jgi:transmembrane sensor
MEAERERLHYLFKQAVSKRSTPEELDEFWEIINALQGDDELRNELTSLWETDNENQLAKHPDWDNMLTKIKARTDEYKFEEDRSTGRLTGLRWLKYAAAVILLFGVGTYMYISNQKEKPSVTQNNPIQVQNDVAPGGNKAILTLADGSKIVLDSAHQGTIAKESNATIIKTAEGKIEYQKGVDKVAVLAYNTMATPRGGQYQLTLPDGSQVWLNAESSITYPTAFTGKERKVSITGEAYFEVVHNAKQPFRVETGSQIVEVLGTHFNINAYNEEPTINTTLLEGAVRIESKAVHTSLILKPGQQGQLAPNKLTIASEPDVEQVMAWKNGLFNFNNADLPTVMRQLERWYDIQVTYQGYIPQFEFKGKLPMNLQLSQVLTILRKVEVKYRIEGRKLIVSP